MYEAKRVSFCLNWRSSVWLIIIAGLLVSHRVSKHMFFSPHGWKWTLLEFIMLFIYYDIYVFMMTYSITDLSLCYIFYKLIKTLVNICPLRRWRHLFGVIFIHETPLSIVLGLIILFYHIPGPKYKINVKNIHKTHSCILSYRREINY